MSDINNKISAKNVFDRHGLSLEGALDVLFSELEKKEIKRFGLLHHFVNMLLMT